MLNPEDKQKIKVELVRSLESIAKLDSQDFPQALLEIFRKLIREDELLQEEILKNAGFEPDPLTLDALLDVANWTLNLELKR